jgi:S-adenosylmethionine:tRNA ribosyltransferase-isomerase
MRVADFDYYLPEELIAQHPTSDRAASRMLVVDRKWGRWQDCAFQDFPSFLQAGDCLIVNDSKVFPSRLYATRNKGSALVEVFLLRSMSPDQLTWDALVRPGKKVPVGERLNFPEGISAEVLERGDHGERILRFTSAGDFLEALSRIGHVPLPPYIKRPDTAQDRDRYQTVFARESGSVAAPTAGLHFTPELVERCRAAGAAITPVTLHVGLGTFAPLHVEKVEDVRLHSERFQVSDSSLEMIRSAQRRVAVGTTSVRAVESAYAQSGTGGETEIFISPGFRFRAIDALLTNFHLPRSSLLMLVSAFAGQDLTMSAYEHAVRKRYRFFSYGDCMLIL